MKTIVTLIIVLFPLTIFAQLRHTDLQASQFGKSFVWRKIESQHYVVIYDTTITKMAHKVLHLLESNFEGNAASLLTLPKHKTTVILNHKSVVPNGFVTYFPHRSEWNALPVWTKGVDFVGANDWLTLLAVHENRHIVQFDKIDKKANRLERLFRGEVGKALNIALGLPTWLLEGDAVGIETAQTPAGRGRNPVFAYPMKGLVLGKTQKSYAQLTHGSYVEKYPNVYEYGYAMASYLKKEHGVEVIGRILDKESEQYSINPFAWAVQSVTKKKIEGVHRDMVKTLDSLYTQEGAVLAEEKHALSPQDKYYTSYLFPHKIGQDSILVYKKGLADIGQLVLLTNNKALKIKDIIGLSTWGFNAVGRYVVWMRAIPDKRWEKEVKSELVMLDLKTKKETVLTSKRNLYNPALSADGRWVVALERLVDESSNIVILDAQTGKESRSVHSSLYLSEPSWDKDGGFIALAGQGSNGKALFILDVASGKLDQVLDFSWEQLASPIFYKNHLLYSSSYDGNLNIYATDLATRKRFRVSESRWGTLNLMLDEANNRVYFNQYTPKGFSVQSMLLDITNWKPIEGIVQKPFEYAEELANQENALIKDTAVPKLEPPKQAALGLGEKYPRIHSWLPLFSSPYVFDFNTPFLVHFIGQNKLTNQAQDLVLGYKSGERTVLGYYGFSTARHKIIADLGLKVAHSFNSLKTDFTVLPTLRLPLSYYTGDKTRRLSSALQFPYESQKGMKLGLMMAYSQEKENLNGNLFTNGFREFNFGISKPLYQSNKFNWFVQSKMHFKGLNTFHGLKLSGFYQKDYFEHGIWGNLNTQISGLRSFSFDSSKPEYKWAIDYTLPLFYPEKSLHRYYIKRVYANAFFEQQKQKGDMFNNVGLQVIGEFYRGHVGLPIHVGVQVSYNFNKVQVFPFISFGIPFR